MGGILTWTITVSFQFDGQHLVEPVRFYSDDLWRVAFDYSDGSCEVDHFADVNVVASVWTLAGATGFVDQFDVGLGVVRDDNVI